MPVISSFFGIYIMMYFDDHAPPHFHAKYNEFKAEILIKELAIRQGKLPPRVLGLVIEWASEHQKELLDNWKRMEDGMSFLNIEPLK